MAAKQERSKMRSIEKLPAEGAVECAGGPLPVGLGAIEVMP